MNHPVKARCFRSRDAARNRLVRFSSIGLMLLAAFQTAAWAAGTTLIPQDRNFRIWMQDSLVAGPGTRLLYHTAPATNQAHVQEKCAANYYVLELKPGLADPRPQPLATDYCGYFGMFGRLLANGDVLIIAGDRVETWRLGKGKVKEWAFSGVASLGGLGKNVNDGGTPIDVARNGDIVMAKQLPRSRKDTTTASAIVVGFSADGNIRWQFELQESGALVSVMNIWATADGGALLHTSARPMSGVSLPGAQAVEGANVTGQNRLYRISESGESLPPIVVAIAQQPDYQNPKPLPDVTKDPAGFQAALQHQRTLFNMEVIDQIAAHSRADGSVDVLFRRSSNDEARKGTWFQRVGPDGSVGMQASLGKSMAEQGLTNWFDFSVAKEQVVLFGTVGTRANRLNQGYLSWVTIPDGAVVTRLVPLRETGLEAAKRARDEDVKSLEDYPAQEPVLLGTLGGRPLTVSLVKASGRPAMQIDEGTEQLAAYTEGRGKR